MTDDPYRTPARDALGAVAEDDQLLEIIACCHADTAAAAEFKTQPLNILIRCLCFFCINYMNIMIIHYFRFMPLYSICIKYKN